MQRTEVTDALKAQGFPCSFRGFRDSHNQPFLAIDGPELSTIRAFLVGRFPTLTVDEISRMPYASGMRLIVRGF